MGDNVGRTMRVALVAASALLAFAAGDAQAQAPVAGTYNWELPLSMRRGPDGTTEGTGDVAKVTLKLEVRGDSVYGSMDVAAPNRPAQPAREFKGTVKGNTVVFAIVSQARINANGEERALEITNTYTATIDGD